MALVHYLDATIFKAAVKTLKTSKIDKINPITKVEFFTDINWYRPTGSKFVTSLVTKNGRIDVYTIQESNQLLILSNNSAGNMIHSLYTKSSEHGFTVNEMIDIAENQSSHVAH
ncbi:hypothetical protein [Paraglaciecola sp. 20A4]|uniref:hypothetical protein n=1 Tax=Paraglaciecola sp. 20A4 TaxID=2687288 RepID=UPI001407A91B|nr:hypothetical protein [Paraglaciecola sp. 20A4]